jgi:hypothetical protein
MTLVVADLEGFGTYLGRLSKIEIKVSWRKFSQESVCDERNMEVKMEVKVAVKDEVTTKSNVCIGFIKSWAVVVSAFYEVSLSSHYPILSL